MRANLEDNLATRLRQKSTKWGTLTLAMTGDFVVSSSGPTFLFLDPGASTRIVRLPPLEDGMMYLIKNTGNSNSLNVVDFGGSGVITFTTGKGGIVFASQFMWAAVSDASGPQGPAGPPGTAQITGTSTSSQTIGSSGTKTFTVLPVGLGYSVGLRVRASDTSAPATNYMEGVTTAYNSGTGVLSFTADNASGAGTLSSWTVNVAGDKGATGASGAGTGDVIGPTGATASALARFDLATGKLIKNSVVTSDDSTGTLAPTSNDLGALGKATLSWSDLFLATGGVINWANSDFTATHSAGTLTLSGTLSIGSNAFTCGTIEIGNTTDATIGRSGAGDITVEGNRLFRVGGADVPLADGGTGQSSASAGFDALTVHGSDVVAAGTTNLDSATGSLVDITGTTTITAITLSDGRHRWVRFTGSLTLTNGASLVLPGAANIVTQAGDYAEFAGYAAGVVRCTNYSPAAKGDMRTLVGVRIGTDVQAWDTDLDTLAALGNNKVAYTNNTGVQTALSIGANGTVLQSAGTNATTNPPTFTATPQLGVASTTTGQLKLANSGNTGILTVQYASSANSYTWTWPSAVPATAGMLLGGDTSSSTSWYGAATALAVGFSATSFGVGTVTGAGQTTTPSAASGNFQHLTLNGSSLTGTWTFDVPSTVCSIVVEVTNGGSGAVAATLSTANYTKVSGDTWAGTNGSKFLFFVTKSSTYKHLQIQALQ